MDRVRHARLRENEATRITLRPTVRSVKMRSRAGILSSCRMMDSAGSSRQTASWTVRCRHISSRRSPPLANGSTDSNQIRAASSFHAPVQRIQSVAERGARRSLSVRAVHLSLDGAPYCRRHVANGRPSLRAAAGVFLRGDAGARGTARVEARRVGDDLHRCVR